MPFHYAARTAAVQKCSGDIAKGSNGKQAANAGGLQPCAAMGVFVYTAKDHEYWTKRVVRPAQNFLARGGRSMTVEKAENVGVSS